MATSNSVDFTLDARGIASETFKKLGIRTAETPLEAFEIQDALNQLNLMLKGWQNQGLHLWTEEEGIIFLDVGKENYLLGSTGDEATNLDDFIGTTLTAAKVATDTVIEVSSTTGMIALDNVGIELDDKTRHWTTIVSIVPGVSVTITTGLPSASKSGSTVFTFTKLIQRPLRISSSRRKTFNVDNEIDIMSWSRNEYFNQVNKSSQGTVVNAYYSPLLTNGRYYVWQTASNVNDFVRISFERPIQDIDLTTDNLDIPVEWLETVIYNLAARMVDDYPVPERKARSILIKAAFFLTESLGWDEEIESINIQPDFR